MSAGRGRLERRATPLGRIRLLSGVATAMLFHQRLKLVGTLFGVVFAAVLSNQQLGTFLGLLQKNTMLVDNTQADIWILPAGSETLAPGRTLSTSALDIARVTRGVAATVPLLHTGANVRLPSGGTEAITLVAAEAPGFVGGPWNIVCGDVGALAGPGAMLFEDSQRDILGGLNLGSVREVNGRKITVAGFTWGLIPFGPPYAFADYELGRELTRTPRDQTNAVLVRVEPGASPGAVAAALRERVGPAQVFVASDLRNAIVRYILTKTAIGITFGTSTLFGLIVGFVIVGLSMFSAVVDNIREFGTLKAVGATNGDLALLLLVQAVIVALLGSLFGLALVAQMARGIRSANLALVLPPGLTAATVIFMVLLCAAASTLALWRVRSVEPAMVFR